MNRRLLLATLFLCLFFSAGYVQGQGQANQQTITAAYSKTPLKAVLQDIEVKYKLTVFYLDEWLEGVEVNHTFKEEPLTTALQTILAQAQLTPILYDPHTLVLVPRTEADITENNLVLTDAGIPKATAARMVTISGYVQEAKTKEPGIGATVRLDELKKGTVANEKGYYSLTVPAGNYTLLVSAVGMVTDQRKLQLMQSKIMDVELFEVSNQLTETEVTTTAADQNVKSLEMGVARLSVKELKSMPAFLGEVDVVRSVLAMPGVTTVGEGAAGFNVRGGSTDQNLIVQDDAPLFNSAHLFGFFSVFNPDMVEDVTLYRSGVPSRYGGRVSSVLDVKMRDGNKKAAVVSGGVGLLASRLMVEGPLIKDKVSFVVGGRGAYPGWLFRYIPDKAVRESTGYFYDINGKVSAWLGPKDQLTASGYFSRDGFRFGADTTYTWGTATGSVRWNHTFNNSLSGSLTGVTGDYDYGVFADREPYNFELDSEIKYQLAKLDFLYEPNARHSISGGASSTFYNFKAGSFKPTSPESILQPETLPAERSAEAALYLEHTYTLSEQVSVAYGLRYSSFFNLGPGEMYVYNPEMPRSKAAITDTIQYGSGRVIQKYGYVEPRFSFKLSVSENSSVKVGYNRMVQYTHLISNTTAASPVDVWKPSSAHLKPQIGDQVSVGFFQNLQNNTIELSAEAYYKHLQNLVEYKDGAKLLLNPALEADLLSGKGKAYGLELLLRRKEKKLTGWISYTYSRTLRQVNGETPQEQINKGEYYPSNHDKPHNLNLVINQKLGKRVSAAANFSYSTGRPVTYPESVAMVDGFLIVNYSGRNQHRIPDYHRLDASLVIDGNNRRNSKLQGSWAFSVYNLYSRSNPYSVFFKPGYSGNVPQAYKLAVIGAAVPAISYNFKLTR